MTSSQSKIKTAMILAAGFGTRLKPLTNNTPKPLIKVNNVVLLDRAIQHIRNCGIKEIIINTHYLHEDIHNHIQKYYSHEECNLEIKIIHEKEILGTGGGVWNALNTYKKDEILVFNADIILESTQDILNIIDYWDSNKMEFLLLLKHKQQISYTCPDGDFNITDSHIVRLADKKEMTHIYTGVYIINKKAFEHLKRKKDNFSMTDLWFLSDKYNFESYKFYGHKTVGKWFDIGTHERLNTAELYLKNHEN